MFSDDGEFLPADPENFYSATNWDVVAENCLLAEHEFQIVEDAESFEIKLAEGKVRWEKKNIHMQQTFSGGEWSEAELIRYLENRIRDRNGGRYIQAALRTCIDRNLDALKGRGYETEKIARFKSQLAQALHKRLLADGVAAQTKTMQQFLFDGKRRLSEYRFHIPAQIRSQLDIQRRGDLQKALLRSHR